MLGSMTCVQVLQVVGHWNALRFSSSKEVPGNGIDVIAEGDFDWPL